MITTDNATCTPILNEITSPNHLLSRHCGRACFTSREAGHCKFIVQWLPGMGTLGQAIYSAYERIKLEIRRGEMTGAAERHPVYMRKSFI